MKRRPVLFASAAAVGLWSAWIVLHGASGGATQVVAATRARAPAPQPRAELLAQLTPTSAASRASAPRPRPRPHRARASRPLPVTTPSPRASGSSAAPASTPPPPAAASAAAAAPAAAAAAHAAVPLRRHARRGREGTAARLPVARRQAAGGRRRRHAGRRLPTHAISGAGARLHHVQNNVTLKLAVAGGPPDDDPHPPPCRRRALPSPSPRHCCWPAAPRSSTAPTACSCCRKARSPRRLQSLRKAAEMEPTNARYRIDYLTQRELATQAVLARADEARDAGRLDEAAAALPRCARARRRQRARPARRRRWWREQRRADAAIAQAERCLRVGQTEAAQDVLRRAAKDVPGNASLQAQLQGAGRAHRSASAPRASARSSRRARSAAR